MKKFNETYVIGIDHGYGNMKTANCCLNHLKKFLSFLIMNGTMF